MVFMALAPLPEEILDRFRASSRSRLTQVESAWKAALIGHATKAMLVEMHRNVHTLKGDARMVRFLDIDLVCQKLEDLLAASEDLQYRVTADVDLSVSMALDFIGLLLRRRGDQEVSGIDIPGFAAQVQRTLREQGRPTMPSQVPTASVSEGETTAAAKPGPQSTHRLATAATKVFLEYLSAAGVARTRLRGVWRDLQAEIEQMESVAVAPILERHCLAARSLSSEMGLEVLVESSAPADLRVSPSVAQALDVALLHSARNALSHGMANMGSSEGRLNFTAIAEGDMLELNVRDNGQGIDVEQIRARAVSNDVMHQDLAKVASREELLNLLFEPRFSTREHADAIAGRGLGLDVVRDAITGVGGTAIVDGHPGEGAQVTIRVPVARRELEIHIFEAYGGRLALGVPASWSVENLELAAATDPVDPLDRLQVRRPSDETGLTQAGPPQVLRLRHGERCVELVAAKSTRMATACRICPTPEDFPAEVVTVEGAEVLLLRPDKLLRPASTKDESNS